MQTQNGEVQFKDKYDSIIDKVVNTYESSTLLF